MMIVRQLGPCGLVLTEESLRAEPIAVMLKI
jgi:hypothetical protein